MSRYSLLCVSVCLALAPFSANAAEWGNLSGRFVYDGKAPAPVAIQPDKDPQVCAKNPLFEETLVVDPKGGLANVVVYVRTKKVAIHPDYEALAAQPVVIDNRDCKFQPHVTGMWTKQTLVLKNSDPVGHNSKIEAFANAGINPLIPAMGSVEQKFALPEAVPMAVSCNIHPWMRGYLAVRPDPYFAISAGDGSFEIKNLPAGTQLEFQVWHEAVGYLKGISGGKIAADARGRFEMTLAAGDNNVGEFKVKPAAFKK